MDGDLENSAFKVDFWERPTGGGRLATELGRSLFCSHRLCEEGQTQLSSIQGPEVLEALSG